MPGNPNNLSRFWQELKRRKVVRVVTVYAAAAFVILELTDIVAPSLGLPGWTLNLIIILLIVGFIIAVILSWIYDITPEGVQKTESSQGGLTEPQEKPSQLKTWKIATYASVTIIIGLIVYNIFRGRSDHGEVYGPEKTIAVLPFENMSDEDEYTHFGDAITDEIIMQLYKIKAFEVRSRTSIMQYRHTDKSIPAIGKELNANYILEGTTQRHENQVRIRVQLIHAQSDDHVWGEVFEGEWQDIFDIQIEVAKQIAAKLKTVLSQEEIERIEAVPTENIDAYTYYLQGRFAYNNLLGRDALDRSMEFYRKALEIDPEYALAYSGMAATYTSYATWGYAPRKNVMYQAKNAAIKALEIDSKLGEAHAELAWARIIHDWDWTGGESEIKRALELNPNYASAHSKYAWLLSFVGRHKEAIKETQKALELDPLFVDMWVELGRRYYFAREYDRAMEIYRKALEKFPGSEYATIFLALALSKKGLHAEAIKEGTKISESSPWLWCLGYIYGAAGQREKAWEILDYYNELSKEEFVWLSNFTFIYAGLGEVDKAFEWLEKTYEQREAWLDLIQVEPMYDSLRSDPRFQELVDRMNFPEN